MSEGIKGMTVFKIHKEFGNGMGFTTPLLVLEKRHCCTGARDETGSSTSRAILRFVTVTDD
jgi:hypothetical protein